MTYEEAPETIRECTTLHGFGEELKHLRAKVLHLGYTYGAWILEVESHDHERITVANKDLEVAARSALARLSK
jgi:spermidine synthase